MYLQKTTLKIIHNYLLSYQNFVYLQKRSTDMGNAELVQRAATALQTQEWTAEDVVEAWARQLDCADSSRKLYKRVLQQYFAWVNRSGRMLSAMTRADIIEYRDALLNGTATEDGKPKSALTTASYLTAVKLFYKWLHASNVTITDITEGVKAPRRTNKFEREPLTAAQAQALTEEVAATGTTRDIAIINLLLRTGMRTIEVARANIEDMQLLGGQVVLYVQGKGHVGKDNFVIVTDKCRAAIAAYLATRPNAAPTAPLFASDSNNNNGGRLTTRTISDIAKRHLKAVGLDSRSYTAHSLRHTYGTRMLRATNNMEFVQKQMRHASMNTTNKYTYHEDAERRIELAQQYNIDNIY